MIPGILLALSVLAILASMVFVIYYIRKNKVFFSSEIKGLERRIEEEAKKTAETLERRRHTEWKVVSDSEHSWLMLVDGNGETRTVVHDPACKGCRKVLYENFRNIVKEIDKELS